MSKQTGARATGPYLKRRTGRADKWVIAVFGDDGQRIDPAFETEAEAIAYRDSYNESLQAINTSTVEEAIVAYLAEKALDCKPTTLDTLRYRLRNILGPILDFTASDIPRAHGSALYAARVKAARADTHQAELNEARRFFAWAIKARRATTSPFSGVESVGKRSKGKKQLHVSEADKFIAAALAAYDGEGRLAALAALCALLLGPRTSEIVNLTVRDVDDGGRLVWLYGTKSAAARRPVLVPEVLVGRLAALAAGREGSEPLWRAQHHRRWPLRAVQALCAEAGVPVVTAHGLRGTLATLGIAGGAALLDVAKQLGHSSTQVTTQHYVMPGTGAEAARARGLRMLKGGK